jgi:hypothetical protein
MRYTSSSIQALCAVVVLLFGSSASAQNERATGLVFSDRSIYESIPLATRPLMGDLPPSVDLSRLFPNPGYQGRQGSCVGWAVAYALKTFQEAQERSWSLNTTSHQFSPAYIYNQIKLQEPPTDTLTPDEIANLPTGGCRAGSHLIDALDILTRTGVAPLSDFNYDATDCTKKPSQGLQQRSQEFAIASWRRVNVQDLIEVKSQIAGSFPVLIGIEVDDEFRSLTQGQIYRTFSGHSVGGHALVIVGYDDQLGAFKVINSWGITWGDAGFGWISYNAFRQMVREGFVVQDIVPRRPPDPVPSPTPIPQPTSDTFTVHPMAKAILLERNPDVYRFTLWLSVPDNYRSRIKEVAYLLNHRTLNFVTMRSSDPSDGFAVGYTGWGCLRNVIITMTMSDGTSYKFSFDMCPAIGWKQ